MATEPLTDDQVRFLMQVASSARRVEREECAKLCEKHEGLEYAELIRARKNGD